MFDVKENLDFLWSKLLEFCTSCILLDLLLFVRYFFSCYLFTVTFLSLLFSSYSLSYNLFWQTFETSYLMANCDLIYLQYPLPYRTVMERKYIHYCSIFDLKHSKKNTIILMPVTSKLQLQNLMRNFWHNKKDVAFIQWFCLLQLQWSLIVAFLY